MAEQTDHLEKHIQSKRNELGQNLEELESKVKSAGDWHTYFERYPMAALGISFCASDWTQASLQLPS